MRRTWKAATLALILVSVFSKAQTATLTPGQASAIKAEEARWNANDLGNYGYASVTYTLDHVAPAKKSTLTPNPKPGTVAAYVVEHLTGGKSPQPGYRPSVFWLEPQGGDSWKAGYPVYCDRGDIYPSAAAAAEVYKRAKPLTAQDVAAVGKSLSMAQMHGLIAIVMAIILFVGGPIFYFIWGLKKGSVPSKVVCPGCSTVNYPQAAQCANCGSMNTYLGKRKGKKGWRITSICKNCKGWTKFDPYCAVCETNLTHQLVYGHGKAFDPR